MTISKQPIELSVSRVQNSSRRAIISILIGCAVMFGILQIGVTWLAMQIGIVFMVYAFLGNLLKSQE